MKKFYLILITFIVLMPTFATNANAQTFSDILPWAKEEVMYLNKEGVVEGRPDGTFGSKDTIIRGDAALMIARAHNLDTNNVNKKSSFTDVDEKMYYHEAIEAAVKAGFLKGYPDGSFAPKGTLTRQEMAKIIADAYNLKGTSSNMFNDLTNTWAKTEIEALASNGISNGTSKGKFEPKANITRTEFSVMLSRAMNDKFKLKTEKPNVVGFEKIKNKEVFVGDNLEDIDLPNRIDVYYSNDHTASKNITWNTSKIDFEKPGSYKITGKVQDVNKTIEIKVKVKKIEVKSIEKIEYDSIKIGENYYGYGSDSASNYLGETTQLHEAILNNGDKTLFIDHFYGGFQKDPFGVPYGYGDIVNLVLIATDNYKVIGADNPFLDGIILKHPTHLDKIKKEYPKSKLSFKLETVYESMSESYEGHFISYEDNEYEIPFKLAKELRTGNSLGNIYFENQDIRHLSTSKASPYVAINDLFNYFGIDKTISYGTKGNEIYLEIK